jgi:hypothetical protein
LRICRVTYGNRAQTITGITPGQLRHSPFAVIALERWDLRPVTNLTPPDNTPGDKQNATQQKDARWLGNTCGDPDSVRVRSPIMLDECRINIAKRQSSEHRDGSGAKEHGLEFEHYFVLLDLRRSITHFAYQKRIAVNVIYYV